MIRVLYCMITLLCLMINLWLHFYTGMSTLLHLYDYTFYTVWLHLYTVWSLHFRTVDSTFTLYDYTFTLYDHYTSTPFDSIFTLYDYTFAVFQDMECVKQVRSLLVSQCQKCGGDGRFSKVLNDGDHHVGLLVSERYINIPPQISVPMFESLL